MNSAFDFPRGARVVPLDDRTARILGRRLWVPVAGTVTGHARGGDFLLVHWDGDACSVDDTVHHLNVRLTETAMNSIYFTGSDFWLTSTSLDATFLADLLDCATPGQAADESVEYVRQRYVIRGDVEDCRAYLKGYGAWDDEQLADHEANLDRLVWLTGGALRECGEATFSTY